MEKKFFSPTTKKGFLYYGKNKQTKFFSPTKKKVFLPYDKNKNKFFSPTTKTNKKLIKLVFSRNFAYCRSG
jgi:hypothetical protein